MSRIGKGLRKSATRARVGVLALLLCCSSAAAAEVALFAGAFDTNAMRGAIEIGAEVRPESLVLAHGSFWDLGPAFGVLTNEAKAVYGWAGFRLSVHPWVAPLRLTIYSAAGYYQRGDAKDLGGPLEFRSGVELSVLLGREDWLGLSFYHLSNADIYEYNPGTNSLMVVYSF